MAELPPIMPTPRAAPSPRSRGPYEEIADMQRPDPTSLTTSAILREVAMVERLIGTRLDGMDKALALASEYPTAIDKAVKELKELHEEKFQGLTTLLEEKFSSLSRLREEKFNAVQTQFVDRDKRREAEDTANKLAVSTALQTARDSFEQQNSSNAVAIGKSEAAYTKQIDQIILLLNTSVSALSDKIEDLRTRLTLAEGKTTGAGNLWGFLVGGIGLFLTISTLFFMFATRVTPPM